SRRTLPWARRASTSLELSAFASVPTSKRSWLSTHVTPWGSYEPNDCTRGAATAVEGRAPELPGLSALPTEHGRPRDRYYAVDGFRREECGLHRAQLQVPNLVSGPHRPCAKPGHGPSATAVGQLGESRRGHFDSRYSRQSFCPSGLRGRYLVCAVHGPARLRGNVRVGGVRPHRSMLEVGS